MRWRPRFSLRTLLLLTLLIGGGGLLYVKREPWQVAAVLKPECTDVNQISFSPNGRKLLAGLVSLNAGLPEDTPAAFSASFAPALWDMETLQSSLHIPITGLADYANRMGAYMNFDGDDVIAVIITGKVSTVGPASIGPSTYLWFNANTGAPIGDDGKHVSRIERTDGQRYFLVYENKPKDSDSRHISINVWDSVTAKKVSVLQRTADIPNMGNLIVSGKFVYSAFASYKLDGYVIHVAQWDAQTGELLGTDLQTSQSLPCLNNYSADGAYSIRSSRALWEISIGLTPLYNAKTGKVIASLNGSPIDDPFSPDGRLVATFDEVHNSYYVWNCSDGKLAAKIRGTNRSFDNRVQTPFSPDGNWLYTNYEDEGSSVRAVHLWNSKTLALAQTLPPNDDTERVQFILDGRRGIISRSGAVGCLVDGLNRSFELIDTATGKTILNQRCSFHVSMDGRQIRGYRRLQSEPQVGEITIWDSETGAELARIPGAYDHIAFSPNDTIATSTDNTIRLWKRVRDEHWYGYLQLREFWLTVVLAIGFLWSVKKERPTRRT